MEDIVTYELLLEYKLIPIVIGMILLSIWLWKSSDSDE